MKSKATLYHDGCAIRLGIEATFATSLDPSLFEIETVNLSLVPERIDEAAQRGVVALPALILNGQVFAINPHSDLEHLRQPLRDDETVS
jgi:hypothetical protein